MSYLVTNPEDRFSRDEALTSMFNNFFKCILGKNTKWTCDSVGYYQDLAASKVSFSEDGSLLAVVFGSCITLWEPETCLLKRTLVLNMSKEEIR